MANFFGNIFGEKDKHKRKEDSPVESKKENGKDTKVPAGLGGSTKMAELLKEDSKGTNNDVKPTVASPEQSKADSDKSNADNTETAKKASTDNHDTTVKKDDKHGKTVSVQDEPDLKPKPANKRPENPTKPIVVSFTYKGKKIRNDFIFTDKMGTHLKLSDLPEVKGYKLNLKNELNYQIGRTIQHVILHYLKDEVKYDLIPVTEDLKSINPKAIRHYEGRPGTEISATKFPVIKGYRVYTSRKYEVPADGKDVKVVYTPTTQTIHLIYQTIKGEVLGTSTKSGKTGEAYSIDPKKRSFAGYQLSKLPKNLKGTFPAESMDITIEYEPISSKIEVSFLDESGKPIHAPMEFEKKYKDAYHIKLPVTDGYELVSNPSLLNGFYDRVTKHIVLRYKRATAKFNINFWFDKDFKHSAGDPRPVSGRVGDPFAVQVPEHEGYTPDKTVVKGKFSPYDNPDVDVVYSKIPAEVHITLVDEADRPLPNQPQIVKKGFWGDYFETELPEIPGFKRPMKVLKKKFYRAHQAEEVHYVAQEVSLVVNYIDNKTKKPIDGYPAFQKPGLSGTSYSIEGEMIDGYRLIGLPDNASGIYTAKPITVNLMYDPNPSEIVIHRVDSTLNPIRKTEIRSGYYGQTYDIKTDDIPGFKFISASDDLKGKFPASRLDLYLNFEAADVTFTFVPVDQFGKPFGDEYNIVISGKAGQEFSHDMPDIPGYLSTATEISGKIKAEYQNEKIMVPYKPKDETITVHTIYAGGNKDGMHPFHDFTQPGPVGSTFKYESPTLPGFEANPKNISAKFAPEPQEVTIVYTVKQEEYLIQFVDLKGQLVGGMPKAKGYYKEAISIGQAIPRGFHLPDGVDSHVYLDGSGDYRVQVIPDRLTIELIAQTVDGTDLGSRRQIDGDYHEVKTVNALPVPGYTPVKGDKVSIKFELGQTTYPIIYEPEDRTLTISYINATTGKSIAEKKIVHGKFNGEYDERAKQIPGFVAINRTHEAGTFGMQDIEMAFLYRASSDDLNRAITPIEEIIKENQQANNRNAQAVVQATRVPEVETPPYDSNDTVPSAQLKNTHVEHVANTLPRQPQSPNTPTSNSAVSDYYSNSQDDPAIDQGASNLMNKLYGKQYYDNGQDQ